MTLKGDFISWGENDVSDEKLPMHCVSLWGKILNGECYINK